MTCTLSDFLNEIKPVTVEDHILILHSTNGIARIEKTPAERLMNWYDAITKKGGWVLPTIEELEFVYQVYVGLKIMKKIDFDPSTASPFWSSTTPSTHDENAMALDFKNGKRVLKNRNEPLEVIRVYHETTGKMNQ